MAWAARGVAALVCIAGALSTSSADDRDNIPADGRLDASGEMTDGKNGVLDEPGAIVVGVEGCASSVPDGAFKSGAQVEGYCGCMIDWLRTSSPKAVRAFTAATKSGDLSAVDLNGMKACAKWAADGMRERQPHLRPKMLSSIQVWKAYLACAKTTPGRAKAPEGMRYCNRLVGSTDVSLRTH